MRDYGRPSQEQQRMCRSEASSAKYIWMPTEWSSCSKCDPIEGIVRHAYKRRALECLEINEISNETKFVLDHESCRDHNFSIPALIRSCPKTNGDDNCYRWSAGCNKKLCSGEIVCEKFDSKLGTWTALGDNKKCELKDKVEFSELQDAN